MKEFSLKESLIKLKEKNYDNNINQTINLLVEKFDEDQLKLMAHYQGIKVDNRIIRLFFMQGVGFRCYNEKNEIYGKLPLCKNIENFMNKLYLDFNH
jgi:hypothetical protein